MAYPFGFDFAVVEIWRKQKCLNLKSYYSLKYCHETKETQFDKTCTEMQAMERGSKIKQMVSNNDKADKKRIKDKYKLHIEKIEKERAKRILEAEIIDKETYNKRKSGVAKTNLKRHKPDEPIVKLLMLIFRELGIDVSSGIGTYAQEQAKKARDAIKQDASLQRYITHKLHLRVYSNLSDIAFIHKIIKKLLGLKTNNKLMREGKDFYRIYCIDQTSMLKLKKYHDLKYGDNRDDET